MRGTMKTLEIPALRPVWNNGCCCCGEMRIEQTEISGTNQFVEKALKEWNIHVE